MINKNNNVKWCMWKIAMILLLTNGSFGDQNFILYILSDFNYEICPMNGLKLCGATSRECDGGLYEYYDFIKNSRNLSDNLFWIGAGRFFDQKAYSVLHYSPLVNSLKLLDLDMINLDAEVYTNGIEFGIKFFISREELGDSLVSANLPNVKNQFISKNIENSQCKLHLIGFENKDRADRLQISNLIVKSEIESVKSIINSLEKTNSLFIMIGNSNETMAKSYLNAIPELNGVILNGFKDLANLDQTTPLIYKNNQHQWVLAVNHSNSNILIGKANFSFDTNCKITNITGSIEKLNFKPLENPENEPESLIKKTYKILMRESGVLAQLRVQFSNENCKEQECSLGSTIADATYAYIISTNSKKEINWPDPVAGVLIHVITTEPVTISPGPVMAKDLKKLFKDDFLCNFNADISTIIKIISNSDYFIHVSASMKVKITKTASSSNMEIYLLTEKNTFTTLETTKDTKLPWIAPCTLLNNEKIATLVKANGRVETLEIMISDVLKEFIHKESEQEMFLPSIADRYIIVESECSIAVPIIMSVIVSVSFMLGCWAFWKFILPRCRRHSDERIHILG